MSGESVRVGFGRTSFNNFKKKEVEVGVGYTNKYFELTTFLSKESQDRVKGKEKLTFLFFFNFRFAFFIFVSLNYFILKNLSGSTLSSYLLILKRVIAKELSFYAQRG